MEKTAEHLKAETDLTAALAAKATAETALATANTQIATLSATVTEKDGLLVAARANVGGMQAFSINGAAESDPVKVQNHIATLETFRTESIQVGRKNFITDLAKEGKIANPQVEGLQTLALSMTVEQYELFKAGYAAAPAMSLFGRHDLGTSTNGNGAVGSKADQLAVATAIVANHRSSGMSEDQIKLTPSYVQMVELTKN